MLVRSLGAHVAGASGTGRHVHDWGQLIYSSAGVMTVWTTRGSWVAPPRWAVWVPGGVEHQIRFAGPAELRTLYLRADVAARLPPDCQVLTVSPLLRELVLRTVSLGMLDAREPLHAALAQLIAGELAVRDVPALDLPTPASPALRRAADLLSREGEPLGTARVAAQVGLSARTLERRFLEETGMSVAAWGRQARLLNSLSLLAGGRSAKSAAAAAGYRTSSAFVAAFRRTFGATPARYFG